MLDNILDHDLHCRYLVCLECSIYRTPISKPYFVRDLTTIVDRKALHWCLSHQYYWRVFILKVLRTTIVEQQFDRLPFKSNQVNHILFV